MTCCDLTCHCSALLNTDRYGTKTKRIDINYAISKRQETERNAVRKRKRRIDLKRYYDDTDLLETIRNGYHRNVNFGNGPKRTRPCGHAPKSQLKSKRTTSLWHEIVTLDLRISTGRLWWNQSKVCWKQKEEWRLASRSAVDGQAHLNQKTRTGH